VRRVERSHSGFNTEVGGGELSSFGALGKGRKFECEKPPQGRVKKGANQRAKKREPLMWNKRRQKGKDFKQVGVGGGGGTGGGLWGGFLQRHSRGNE